MRLVIPGTPANEYHRPCTAPKEDQPVTSILDSLREHLESTGKICPRPWCWRRFFILFNPGYEPPWLSSWWSISTQEKKALFLKQMEFLAYQSDHFHDACRFLQEMDHEQWLYK